ncbi:MAG: hypothetical protein GY853_11210 [PVC group bacterium]|nr:hypothetical protein [PVC group bacterium]
MKLKKSTYVLLICLVICFGFFVWTVLYTGTPMRNGLYLRYKLVQNGVDIESYQKFSFSRINLRYFTVDIESKGLIESKGKDRVDCYFTNEEDCLLTGPVGGLLWIDPDDFKKDAIIAGSQVQKTAAWKGYNVWVLKDQSLENCYGYYDQRTGLQVGFENQWSSKKLEAILTQTNAKVLGSTYLEKK